MCFLLLNREQQHQQKLKLQQLAYMGHNIYQGNLLPHLILRITQDAGNILHAMKQKLRGISR
jgi:hypothetical protein